MLAHLLDPARADQAVADVLALSPDERLSNLLRAFAVVAHAGLSTPADLERQVSALERSCSPDGYDRFILNWAIWLHGLALRDPYWAWRGIDQQHSLYSDDHGKTWHIGYSDDSFDGVLNTNESTAAQLRDGRIYFNTRDQNGTSPSTRADGISVDGGKSLLEPYAEQPDLVGPVVQGSVLQVRGAGWPLLFSGPSNPSSRARMAIRVSHDAGQSWTESHVVSENPAAYSDLVQLPGRIGLLYETGESDTYEIIRFLRIPLPEVTS